MAIPAFDIDYFRQFYPMYASISDDILTNLWTGADVFGTPIISYQPTADKQRYFYYVVEAHLAELYLRGPGATGITSSTSQGSVSIAFEVDKSNSLLFWNQTSWGMQIAYLMKKHGGFALIPGRCNSGSLFNNWR